MRKGYLTWKYVFLKGEWATTSSEAAGVVLLSVNWGKVLAARASFSSFVVGR